MKYYLAGPMAGIADRNFPMFERAAKWLREIQHLKILSPAELNRDFLGKGRSVCMRRDIEFVMQADGVIFLPGWLLSQGAMTEYAVANQLGLALYQLVVYPEMKLKPFIGNNLYSLAVHRID